MILLAIVLHCYINLIRSVCVYTCKTCDKQYKSQNETEQHSSFPWSVSLQMDPLDGEKASVQYYG